MIEMCFRNVIIAIVVRRVGSAGGSVTTKQIKNQ